MLAAMRCRLLALSMTLSAALAWGCADDGGRPLTLPERDTSAGDVALGDVCQPGKWYCESLTVSAQCNATGDGPKATTPCEAGTACSPGSGACVSQICAPHQTICASDQSVARCRGDGLDVLPADPCAEGSYCVDGHCVLGSCLGHVMVLLDRSGSMDWPVDDEDPLGPNRWAEVRDALVDLVATNPAARFGITAFPGSTGTCHATSQPEISLTTYNTAARFSRWFHDNAPYGSTPLLQAMQTMRDHAPDVFGPGGGTLLVVSDGEDTCAHPDLLDQPNLRISNIAKALEDATATLLAEHGVKTFVIGFNYEGEAAELDAIARAGGTGRTAHLPASDAHELSQALGAVVTDWKLCF